MPVSTTSQERVRLSSVYVVLVVPCERTLHRLEYYVEMLRHGEIMLCNEFSLYENSAYEKSALSMGIVSLH